MQGKRSSRVELVALGTVFIGACTDPNIPADRYAYKTPQACVEDWGGKNCQPAPAQAGGRTNYFYGPRFNTFAETDDGKKVWTGTRSQPAMHPSSGKPMGGNAVNVSRGGFGSIGRAFHSIGG
jgi:uncharacterized protein YgiB involved in biofilm formation